MLKMLRIGTGLALFFCTTILAFGQDFTLSPSVQHKLGLESYQGFLLVEDLQESWNSNYAIVSNYDGGILESQILMGVNNLEEAKSLIDQNLSTHSYKGVDIRELKLRLPENKTIS